MYNKHYEKIAMQWKQNTYNAEKLRKTLIVNTYYIHMYKYMHKIAFIYIDKLTYIWRYIYATVYHFNVKTQ